MIWCTWGSCAYTCQDVRAYVRVCVRGAHAYVRVRVRGARAYVRVCVRARVGARAGRACVRAGVRGAHAIACVRAGVRAGSACVLYVKEYNTGAGARAYGMHALHVHVEREHARTECMRPHVACTHTYAHTYAHVRTHVRTEMAMQDSSKIPG